MTTESEKIDMIKESVDDITEISARDKLKIIHAIARKVMADPETDPGYAKVLGKWIKRDEEAIANAEK